MRVVPPDLFRRMLPARKELACPGKANLVTVSSLAVSGPSCQLSAFTGGLI
jgi:hypothetical protein